MAGPLEANTSPPAKLCKSASLNTERDRSSLIGSALTVATAVTKPIAAAINVENNLRTTGGPLREKFTVLKVSNRTLDLSERQGWQRVQQAQRAQRLQRAQRAQRVQRA